MKVKQKLKTLTLGIALVSVLTGCIGEVTYSKETIDKLNSEFDTTFKITKEYKAAPEGTVRGIAKAIEGYYVEYNYDIENGKIETNHDTALADYTTTQEIIGKINLPKDDYVVHSTKNKTVLEITLALKEGVEYDPDKMQAIADEFQDPVSELTVYTVSNASFESLKEDYIVSGRISKDLMKGYLYTEKVTFIAPSESFGCGDTEGTRSTRCGENGILNLPQDG